MILKILRQFSKPSKVLNTNLIKHLEPHLVELTKSDWHKETSNLALKPSSFASSVYQNSFVSKCSLFCTPAQKTHSVECNLSSSSIEKDVTNRTDRYLRNFCSFGAYTGVFGAQIIRENMAEWLTKRDGIKTDASYIKLCDSIFNEFREICSAIFQNGKTSFLLPTPKVPLFDYQIRCIGGHVVYYEVDTVSFKKTLENIKEASTLAEKALLPASCIYFSNPNETTGKRIDKIEDLNNLLEICREKNLLIIADESLQQISLDNKTEKMFEESRKFLSLKSVIKNHGNPEIRDGLELVSGFTINKSIFSDSRISAGFIELVNIDAYAFEMLTKLFSMMIAPNTPGQIATDILTDVVKNRTELSDESLKLIEKEYLQNQIILLESYKKVTQILRKYPCFGLEKQNSGFSIWLKVNFPESVLKKYLGSIESAQPDFCRRLSLETGFEGTPGKCFGSGDHLKFYYLKKKGLEDLGKLDSFLDTFFGVSTNYI